MNLKNRKTKELSFEDDDKVVDSKSNFKSNSKKNEDFDDLLLDKKELENSIKNDVKNDKGEDHSFFNENKKTKKTKVIFISSALVVLLSVGLGVGLGIGLNKKSNNRIDILGNDSSKWIEDYIDFNVNKNDEEFPILLAQSINWSFEEIYSLGFISDYDYSVVNDKLEKNIEEQVNNEKNNYKEQYGNDWKREWDNYLLGLGFDNDDEYIIDLLSKEIKSYVDEVFLSTGKYFIDRIDVSTEESKYLSNDFRTTISNNNFYDGLTVAFDEGDNPSIFGINEVTNRPILNSQFLFESYLNFNPVYAYSEIVLNFTVPSSDLEASNHSSIQFSSIEDLKKSWNFLTSLYVSTETTGNIAENSLDLSNYNLINSKAVDLKNLSFASNNEVYNTTLLKRMEDSLFPSASLSSDLFFDIDSNDLANFSYEINDVLAKSYNEYFSSYGGTDAPSWPGYEGGTSPTDYNSKVNSIEDVGQYQWTVITQNEEIKNDFQTKYSVNLFNGDPIAGTDSVIKDLLVSEDRKVFANSEINYIHNYYNETDKSWELKKELAPVYLTYSTDGLHFIFPAIFSSKEDLVDSCLDNNDYGRLMLISDMDKDISNDYSGNEGLDGLEPKYNQYFEILNSYDTWWEENSSFIYLNTALNNEDFRNEYLINFDQNNDEIVETSELKDLVDYKYNSLYWSNFERYRLIINKEQDYFYETNKSIFTVSKNNSFIPDLKNVLKEEIVFLKPGVGHTFYLNTTISIFRDGFLYDSTKKLKEDRK